MPKECGLSRHQLLTRVTFLDNGSTCIIYNSRCIIYKKFKVTIGYQIFEKFFYFVFLRHSNKKCWKFTSIFVVFFDCFTLIAANDFYCQYYCIYCCCCCCRNCCQFVIPIDKVAAKQSGRKNKSKRSKTKPTTKNEKTRIINSFFSQSVFYIYFFLSFIFNVRLKLNLLLFWGQAAGEYTIYKKLL